MGGIYPVQTAGSAGYDPWPATTIIHGLRKWLGGAPMWSVTVLWVHKPWGFPGGAGQGQPPPVFCLGPLGIIYTVIYSWLLLVAGLGPLSEKYGCWAQLLLV